MIQEFVPYKLAKQLQGLGFNEPCMGYYNWKQVFAFMVIGVSNSDAKFALPQGVVVAPLYQQVIRWLWEEHKIWLWVKQEWYEGEFQGWVYCFEDPDGVTEAGDFPTPETAQQVGIERILTTLNNEY